MFIHRNVDIILAVILILIACVALALTPHGNPRVEATTHTARGRQ